MMSFAHALLGRCGIRAFRLRTLPFGADEFQDIARLARAEPRVVFDIGANVGRKSLEYARHFKSARIYAFEPFADAFGRLKRNTAGEPRIEAVKCAMGAAAGTGRAPQLAGPSALNSLKPGLNEGSATGVETFAVQTVDAFCAERGIDAIDLLKTDTEGFDVEVLRGAAGMLARKRVRLILSECAFDRADTRHTNFFDLYDLLTGHGYRFLGLCETVHKINGDRGIDFSNALFGE